ncbi:MAG: hypothetical protein VXW38_06575 [Bacteroidota bacterium]|nr:hypothetical protein [Bacteroidota bacterium]
MTLSKLCQHVLIISLLLWGNRIISQDPDCPFLDDYIGQNGSAIASVTFQNIEDQGLLELLLKKIKPSTKIAMFGEQHWMSEINQFKTRVITLLAAKMGFTNTVIEIPYSYTGFVNEYIQKKPGEGDDILKLLSPNFNPKEDILFLKELQAWNNDPLSVEDQDWIKPLTSLKQIYLWKTDIKPEYIEQIHKTSPELQIIL